MTDPISNLFKYFNVFKEHGEVSFDILVMWEEWGSRYCKGLCEKKHTQKKKAKIIKLGLIWGPPRGHVHSGKVGVAPDLACWLPLTLLAGEAMDVYY